MQLFLDSALAEIGVSSKSGALSRPYSPPPQLGVVRIRQQDGGVEMSEMQGSGEE